MDENAKHLSRMIEGFSRALAEYTVTRHAEIDPDLSDRYGPGWRSHWVGDVQSRLSYLAQAVAVRKPELFVDAVLWSRTAFVAREVRPEDLETSLRALREVLGSELPKEAVGTALAYVDEALGGLGRAVEAPPTHLDPAAPHGELLLRYLEAILDGRRLDAVDSVLAAAASGVPVRTIYTDVLGPAQAEIGRMWHLGEIGIADEHYGTATTQMTMSRLRAHFPRVDRKNHRIVAVSVGGDLHEIGIRIVADFFEMAGWNAHYLGANVPTEEVIRTLQGRDVDLLAVSAGTSLHLRAMGELIDAVRSAPGCERVRILVGGAAFAAVPDAWRDLGADAYAASAAEAVERGTELVGNPA